MAIEAISIRFFCCDNVLVESGFYEVAIVEIDEATFVRLEGVITYERHTVSANGIRQVCLTIDAFLGDLRQ
jgi:hypothetical protein